MTIKIQELESLQDLTEVELEKVVGGQSLGLTEEQENAINDFVNNLIEANPEFAFVGESQILAAIRRFDIGELSPNFVGI